MVLIMSVNPGLEDRFFKCLDKIRELSNIIKTNQLSVQISRWRYSPGNAKN